MIDYPYLQKFYRQFGGSGLRSAVLANRQGRLTYNDVISFALPAPYQGEVLLRPATNDLFTLDEVFLTQVYKDVVLCLRDVRTVIDLGANIGLASIYFLHHFPYCKLLAVEPDPVNFQLLTNNLRFHLATERAHNLQAAFWKEDGPVIYEPARAKQDVNKGFVRPENSTIDRGPGIVSEGLSMGSIIERSHFRTVDLVKIDIEGSERHIFSGDLGWLSRVRCLAIEFHDKSRESSNFDLVARSHGFCVSDSNQHTVIAKRHGG